MELETEITWREAGILLFTLEKGNVRYSEYLQKFCSAYRKDREMSNKTLSNTLNKLCGEGLLEKIEEYHEKKWKRYYQIPLGIRKRLDMHSLEHSYRNRKKVSIQIYELPIDLEVDPNYRRYRELYEKMRAITYINAAVELFGLLIFSAIITKHFVRVLRTQIRHNYKKAIKIDPNLGQAHRGLGDLYSRTGRVEEAILSYRRAIEVDPDSPLNYNNLAWLLASLGRDLDEAQRLAEKAVSMDPRSPVLLDTLGYVYYVKGMYQEAITNLMAARAADRDNPLIAYHLGMAYWKAGRREEAARELGEALKMNPSFEGAEEARKILRQMKGR